MVLLTLFDEFSRKGKCLSTKTYLEESPSLPIRKYTIRVADPEKKYKILKKRLAERAQITNERTFF